eukprot:6303818-Pyramimonas_sp.AAC.1
MPDLRPRWTIDKIDTDVSASSRGHGPRSLPPHLVGLRGAPPSCRPSICSGVLVLELQPALLGRSGPAGRDPGQ